MQTVFDRCVTAIYLFAAVALAGMALLIMIWSVIEVYDHIVATSQLDATFISTMLQSVGAVIISVAILDVAKYMIEEEVLKKKELGSLRETRETLSKIVAIVAIAVSIEGLIYIFKAGAEDIRLLVYPALLIVAAVVLIVGLGIYQKLSVEIERDQ